MANVTFLLFGRIARRPEMHPLREQLERLRGVEPLILEERPAAT